MRISCILLVASMGCFGARSLRAERAQEGALGPNVVVEHATVAPTNQVVTSGMDPLTHLRLTNPARGGMLSAGRDGLARLIGPAQGSNLLAGAAVDFLAADSRVLIRVIDGDGSTVNTLVVASEKPGRWAGDVGELKQGPGSRLEVKVLAGSAVATAYRTDSEYITTIPVLRNEEVANARGGTAAFAVLRRSLTTGSNAYSRSYDWPGTSFTLVIAGGPASTCGDIHTFRNGSWAVTNNWACTDGSGNVTKGPWDITTSYPGQNQTDDPTYIEWPGGAQTTQTWHIIDTVNPILIISNVPALFHGTATATAWGLGFATGITTVSVWYQQDPPYGLYYDPDCSGSFCFTSASPVLFTAPTDIPSGQRVFSLNWHYYSGGPACPVNHTCAVFAQVTNNVGDPYGDSTVQSFQYYP